jgi:FixJ family two-component response regulator
VPIILMSGHPDMMESVPGSGRPFILKPFSLTSLLTTVQRAIESSPSRVA